MRELPRPLTVEALCPPWAADELPFETTAELQPLDEVLDQERATEALRFAASMPHAEYNVFALGPPGVGRHFLVRRLLEEVAADRPTPPDQAYVSDFDLPNRPRHLLLPAGRGRELRADLDHLVEDLAIAVPAAFEAEEYRARLEELQAARAEETEAALKQLETRAEERGYLLLRTPTGLGLAPGKDGKVLSPAALASLTDEQEAELARAVPPLRAELEEIIRQMPLWEKELRDQVRALDEEVGAAAVDALMAPLRQAWAEHDGVSSHLDAMRDDAVANAQRFRPSPPNPLAQALGSNGDNDGSWLRRYRVNLVVDHAETTGAPVIVEERPRLGTLVGRIEHQARLGTLVTDFTRIRAGDLHRANGGFIALDADKLLTEPFAWSELKQALRSGEVRIQSVGEAAGLVSTDSLEPEPAPLSVRVVLIGTPRLYYLLSALDPEFGLLFKVPADFEPDVDRDGDGNLRFARLLAMLARHDDLRPLDCEAVARVMLESSRRSAHSERLSVHLDSLSDLLREADYRAGVAEREVVTLDDVRQSVEASERWGGRLRDRVLESIDEDTVHLETEGRHVGQINGLSVTQLGTIAFGRPTRISASVRLGRGTVLDIEREVALGGPIHSKGVLILSGFLGSRFGQTRPLALSASLVFEQSYGGVEGDSASLAEACALLSALSEVPLRMDLAVTGSIDQDGRVQAVGGVNEKIEGFFAVCESRGLTGDQGVLIPTANVRHLVLRAPVIDAVREGRFSVTPVASVDEAVALLTGEDAGELADGDWTPGSVMRAVADRLDRFAATVKGFNRPDGAPTDGDDR